LSVLLELHRSLLNGIALFDGRLDLANPCLPGGKLIDVQRDDSGGGCGLRGMTEQALRSYAIISLA
jgi:hypothetical protein